MSMARDLPLRSHPDGVLVEAWVVPGAARTEIVGLYAGALRVRVSAPAEGGKANRAAARLIGRTLGGHRAEVIAGVASRRKQVLVAGVTGAAAAERLAGLLAAR